MQIKNITVIILFTLSLIQFKTLAQSVNSSPDQYQKGNLIFKEDFDTDLKNWIAEFSPSPTSNVTIKNGKFVIDVQGGATVWLNKKLSGNLLIEYKRKVILENGPNDRLSDLNQFWMAADPKNQESVYTDRCFRSIRFSASLLCWLRWKYKFNYPLQKIQWQGR